MMYRASPYPVILLMVSICLNAHASEESTFRERRQRMVFDQIAKRGVKEKKVLEAMLKVPRHEFVPRLMRAFAYTDSALPIGRGQTISQPYIVALMTGSLGLEGDERVLEVGTGSGYQSAVLAEIVDEVYSIEIIPELAFSARSKLERLGYKNVEVKAGDGYLGWPEHAPFDAIIVTCAPDKMPTRLLEQLKDGGRAVLPVGPRDMQRLLKLEKRGGEITQEFIADVLFVPMVHGAQE